VDREVFFDTLNAWGKDPSKKFVVLHHSILSEGINVSGLEAVLFMRNMDYIGISQSIGRVIRLGGAAEDVWTGVRACLRQGGHQHRQERSGGGRHRFQSGYACCFSGPPLILAHSPQFPPFLQYNY
jgi:hypothetical protein